VVDTYAFDPASSISIKHEYKYQDKNYSILRMELRRK